MSNEGLPSTSIDRENYENSDIREILEKAELVKEGDVITLEDYEAIKDRAERIAEEIGDANPVKALFISAFIDRKRTAKKGKDSSGFIAMDSSSAFAARGATPREAMRKAQEKELLQ